MKYGILFTLMGVVLLLQAVMHGGLWWAIVWPAASFGIVASAYLGIGPRVFGKRADGTMAWYAVVVLLPYLLLTWLTWHFMRVIAREPCYNEVAPGLLIGRRPLASEIPKTVTTIVDLAAEFPECKAARHGRQYISFPTLDTGIAEEGAFMQVVNRVAEADGVVYIHCAQGHGRTGTLAAAILIVRGHAASVEEAVARLQQVRPRLDLSRSQVAFLKRLFCRLHSPSTFGGQPCGSRP
jgi:protein-tyrosine phosphatase